MILIVILIIFCQSNFGVAITGDNENNNGKRGLCTYSEITKQVTTQITTYAEMETYQDLCKKYWFYKPCVNFREVLKTKRTLVDVTKRISKEKCCNGYFQLNSTTCLPICHHKCIYSHCTAPNECECYPGYVHKTPTECVADCDGCTYGHCIAPKLCQCNVGYDWNAALFECVPMCPLNCINGYCNSPNECKCNDGYTFEENSTNICKPYCKVPCMENEYCSAIDNCSCKIGYERNANRSCIQEYTCNEENCINGNCMENNCVTNSEFNNSTTSTTIMTLLQHSNEDPNMCTNSCQNGIWENDECQCNDGYEKYSLTLDCFDCRPYCTNGCGEHENCTEPEHCECILGYEFVNFTCKLINDNTELGTLTNEKNSNNKPLIIGVILGSFGLITLALGIIFVGKYVLNKRNQEIQDERQEDYSTEPIYYDEEL